MKLPFLAALAIVTCAGIEVHADEWPTPPQQATCSKQYLDFVSTLLLLQRYLGQAPLQPCPIARHIGGVSPSLP